MSLVEVVSEQRRVDLVEASPADDDTRRCPVCSRRLRADNRSGMCGPCQRAHLSPKACACGCGGHPQQGRAITAAPACLDRVVTLALIARRMSPADRTLIGEATSRAPSPDRRSTGVMKVPAFRFVEQPAPSQLGQQARAVWMRLAQAADAGCLAHDNPPQPSDVPGLESLAQVVASALESEHPELLALALEWGREFYIRDAIRVGRGP